MVIMDKIKAVFMLSTGRAGTGTLAYLCQQSRKALAFHAPKPELIKESFEIQQGKKNPKELVEPKVESILSLVKNNKAEEKTYIETNDKVSLFASELDCFFNCKFFWVIRSPYDFVNSGINRKWYSGKGGFWDEYRFRPMQGWPDEWGVVEKITWLWCEIHKQIERQYEKLADRSMIFYFEDLIGNIDETEKLIKWIGLTDITRETIASVYDLRINAGKYSAPRDIETGDHMFGEKNYDITPRYDFDKEIVKKVIMDNWCSEKNEHYLK